MKISFILSSLWLSGGVRDVLEHANRLVERNHQINFVIPWGTFDPDIGKEINPSIHVIQARISHPVTKTSLTMFEKLILSWKLAAMTPSSDVIISTQTPTTIAGFISSKILRRGKLAWYFQDYIEMFEDKPVEKWLLKNALRWHDIALVLSQDSKEELKRYVPEKKVIISGAGVSHAHLFKPVTIPNDRDKSKRRNILYLGDMRPRKGLSDFLEATGLVHKQIPDIHLWIVSKEECHIQTTLPFTYIFRPPRVELARLFATCDVYVASSWWESFGFPPLEAMASGAPVVMTDSRGGAEYARDGINCLLTRPRDPVALAAAIIRILEDPELEMQLRKNGPVIAAEFSWDKATDRFENALTTLMNPTLG